MAGMPGEEACRIAGREGGRERGVDACIGGSRCHAEGRESQCFCDVLSCDGSIPVAALPLPLLLSCSLARCCTLVVPGSVSSCLTTSHIAMVSRHVMHQPPAHAPTQLPSTCHASMSSEQCSAQRSDPPECPPRF